MDVLEYLKEKSKIVDSEILNLLPESITPKNFSEACRHLIKAGGKRLRPVLALVSSEAVGGEPKRVVESAAALEILHTFTLVHDDIMDQDEFRRGVETVHTKWDLPTAIITGDALFAKVFEAINKNAKRAGISASKIIQLFDIISKTSFELCQGQAMDMEFEKRREVSIEEYLEMVEKKTGALMETSTKTGAILGGGSSKEVEGLGEYGKFTGIAFQIQDDFLGISGQERKAGKPIGSDIREGKWTILAVHAYQNASPKQKDILVETLSKEGGSEKETQKVVEIFEQTGAVEFAEQKSEELIGEAKSNLNILENSEAKNFLLELADFTINREL